MGVDYYNCDICNEIYADCGFYGICKLCNKTVCGSCFTGTFSHFKISPGYYYSVCENHDFLNQNFDSDSDSDSDSKPEDMSWILEKINNDHHCKENGINIPSVKYLLSLKTGNRCMECDNKKCKNFRQVSDYMDVKCCLCTSKDGTDVCKKCRKGNKNEKSIVLINSQLIESCEVGNLKEAIKSLEEGAVNVTEGLNKASMNGHLELVELMIEKGAKNVDDAINLALKEKQLYVVDYLFTRFNKSGNDYIDRIFKVKKRKGGYYSSSLSERYIIDQPVYELLLKHNLTDFNKCLNLACLKNSKEFAEIFISKGANKLEEAMVFACLSSSEDSVSLLIEKGARNFNQCLSVVCSTDKLVYYDEEKSHMLYSGDKKNNINLVKLFLDHGATNLNECLMVAVEKGYVDTVALLIKKGADQLNLARYRVSRCYYNKEKLEDLLNNI